MIQITDEEAREIVYQFGVDMNADPAYFQMTSHVECECVHCESGRVIPSHSECMCESCAQQRVMAALEIRGLARLLEILCPGFTSKSGTKTVFFPHRTGNA
jgi:hypothetical protein